MGSAEITIRQASADFEARIAEVVARARAAEGLPPQPTVVTRKATPEELAAFDARTARRPSLPESSRVADPGRTARRPEQRPTQRASVSHVVPTSEGIAVPGAEGVPVIALDSERSASTREREETAMRPIGASGERHIRAAPPARRSGKPWVVQVGATYVGAADTIEEAVTLRDRFLTDGTLPPRVHGRGRQPESGVAGVQRNGDGWLVRIEGRSIGRATTLPEALAIREHYLATGEKPVARQPGPAVAAKPPQVESRMVESLPMEADVLDDPFPVEPPQPTCDATIDRLLASGFERVPLRAPGALPQPVVTLRKNGAIALNQAAMTVFGRHPTVDVLVNPVARQLVVVAVADGPYRMRHEPTGASLLRARLALDLLQVPPEIRVARVLGIANGVVSLEVPAP